MNGIDDWIFPYTRLGDAIRFRPASLGVFYRLGFDPWEDGDVPLREICVARGVDLTATLEELATLPEMGKGTVWEEFPCHCLIDHLTTEHRSMLHGDLPCIRAILEIPLRAGEESEEARRGIAEALERFATDLRNHIQEEEEAVFPAVMRNERALVQGLNPKPPEHAAARLKAAADGPMLEAPLAGISDRWTPASIAVAPDTSTTAASTLAALRRIRQLAARIRDHGRLVSERLYPMSARLESELMEGISI